MLDFDSASSQYVDCNFYHAEADEFSAMAWVIRDGAGDNANIEHICSQFNGGSSVDSFYISYDPSTDLKFLMQLRNTNLDVYTLRTTSQYTPTIGVLFHVGFTFKRNDFITWYVNGVADGNIAVNDYAMQGQSTHNFTIAARQDNQADRWNGKVFDLKTINTQLSAVQMNNIYYSQGKDNYTGWNCQYRMMSKTDGTAASGANSVIDLSGNSNNGTPTNSPVYRDNLQKTGR